MSFILHYIVSTCLRKGKAAGTLICVIVENSILSHLFQDITVCQGGTKDVSNTTTTTTVSDQTQGCTFSFAVASIARAGPSNESNIVQFTFGM